MEQNKLNKILIKLGFEDDDFIFDFKKLIYYSDVDLSKKLQKLVDIHNKKLMKI